MHNQMGVAGVLGLPGHKVVARTKRIGGGFGGKETRAINLSCAAAVPAYLLRRPVRLIQDRDEDMHTSGHRHPFLSRYKARCCPPCGRCNPAMPPSPLQTQGAVFRCQPVCKHADMGPCMAQVGCDAEGKLRALEVHMYNNGGCSLDLSGSVMDRALLHVDCCYACPNLRAVGYICRTNHASNTAFRGFGGPQARAAACTIPHFCARASRRACCWKGGTPDDAGPPLGACPRQRETPPPGARPPLLSPECWWFWRCRA